MKKPMALALLVVPSVLLVASFASAGSKPKTMKFSAALNIGQEVPHPKGTKAGASGHFTGTVSGTTLKWTLTFAHLSGPGTAAHIHSGVRGKSGPVVVPLCGPCTSPAHGTTNLGVGEVAATAVSAMATRKYYVNVHTAKNPDGEIRGQVSAAQ